MVFVCPDKLGFIIHKGTSNQMKKSISIDRFAVRRAES